MQFSWLSVPSFVLFRNTMAHSILTFLLPANRTALLTIIFSPLCISYFLCLHRFSFYSERGRLWSGALGHLFFATLFAEDFWSLPFHSAIWSWVQGRKTICSKTDNHDLCTWVAGIKVFNELTNICCRGEKPYANITFIYRSKLFSGTSPWLITNLMVC